MLYVERDIKSKRRMTCVEESIFRIRIVDIVNRYLLGY